jgi:hypothetical protein
LIPLREERTFGETKKIGGQGQGQGQGQGRQINSSALSCNFQVDKNKTELINALKWLHNAGDILYYSTNEKLQDIIILSPQWLIDVCAYWGEGISHKTRGMAGNGNDEWEEARDKRRDSVVFTQFR